MPTLPLLATPAPTEIDAPRHVRAPGGYEWWYFEAFDPAADRRVTVVLFDGMPFHPDYLRRYAWYRRFPTRLRPPLPREYPCLLLRVYEKGVLMVGGTWQHPPGACQALSRRVSVAGDGFTREADGTLHLTIPRYIDLTFRPRVRSSAVRTLAAPISVIEPHGWVVSEPLCEVAGRLRLESDRYEPFEGLGYHDHNWGAEPVTLAARRWFWACAWLDDRAFVAAEVVPTRGASAGVTLLDADVPGSAAWNGRSSWRIPYPTVVDFGDALRLDEPVAVESLPIFVQLRYRATVRGVTTTAVAHVVEPGRAAWPVVGRLGERLIERVPT